MPPRYVMDAWDSGDQVRAWALAHAMKDGPEKTVALRWLNRMTTEKAQRDAATKAQRDAAQEQLQRELPPPIRAIVINRRTGEVVRVIRRTPQRRPGRAVSTARRSAGRRSAVKASSTTSRDGPEPPPPAPAGEGLRLEARLQDRVEVTR